MRVPVSWLNAYLDEPADPDRLVEALIRVGVPVEAVSPFGEAYARVLAGRVVSVATHPQSAHLRVARVDVGREVLQVVTGAPNVRVGLMVGVIPAGVSLPGSRTPVEAAVLEGVRSEAVVASARELGIGEDHSGLWELPVAARPGQALADALELNDRILDVEVYANRPDCMAVVGVAREAAAALGRELRLPETTFETVEPEAALQTRVDVEDSADCPRYVARVISDVPAVASPWWMVRRLVLAGMRSVSAIVDVTNYVMLEIGQPLHAFDLDRLEEQRIVVRRARPGESLVTLDGQLRELTPEMLVIADARRPQGLAGVMGGAASEVTPATRHIVLESATFAAARIRRTARRLGLRTEASARFERGPSPDLAEWGSRRAAALMAGLGARVARGAIDTGSPKGGRGEPAAVLVIRPQRINALLGTYMATGHMAGYLQRLGMQVTELPDEPGGAARWEVVLPPWRRDLAEEADVAEEVARLHGYDAIMDAMPHTTARGRRSAEAELTERLRAALRGAGLWEVITYSFMAPEEVEVLGIGPEHPWRRAVRVKNPLTAEQAWMRSTLVPGLLRVIRLNLARRQSDVRIFEVGRVFRQGVPEAEPEELLHVALALWSFPGAPRRQWYEPPRLLDFFDLKGAVEALGRSLRVPVRFEPVQAEGLHPGRAARILTGDGHGGWQTAGVAGELHPQVAAALQLPGRPLVAEMSVSAFGVAGEVAVYQALPRHPAVLRDLALVVPDTMPAQAVLDMVRKAAGPQAQEVTVFDAYTGAGVPSGYRSLGVSVTYRAADRTLTDDEVDAQVRALTTVLERAGVRLRG